MSPIGRVFIVLNLVLAALFLGWAGFYLQNGTNYKKLHGDELKLHGETKTSKDATIAQLTSENGTLKTQLAVANEQVTQKNATIASKENENTDLKARLTNFETKVTEIAGSTSTVASQLESQNNINKELTTKFLTSDKERNEALDAKNDAEARLAAAEIEAKKSEEKIAALSDEIRKKTDETRLLTAWKQNVIAKIPGVEVNLEAAPAIDGQVLAVNANLKLATISVGEGNAEVKPGYRFYVHDGREYKGDIQITDVSDRNAFGNIIPAKGKTINVGDKATTRLR
jgi:3'-phosphoadenosine 5'-phosphosulfate sulfotransferase